VSDTVRLVTIIFPPLVAAGAILLMVSRRAFTERGWERVVVVAVVASIGWGVTQAWRVASSPSLHAPGGRAQVVGCYRVRRGPSFPRWSSRQWPPEVARFDTARWVKDERERAPAPWDRSGHVGNNYWGQSKIRSPDGTPGWWRPTGARFISVQWTHQGMGGFQGSLRMEGADLVGSAKWFQDFHPFFWLPPRLLRVRLIRIDCGELGAVPGSASG